MHIFYSPDINGDTAILSTEESGHCIRVLRLRLHEHVQLMDGKGGFYEAEITDASASACRLNILKPIHYNHSRSFKLHIAIAPTKNTDRFEWFVEKSVEIGIDTITPLLCQRSERRVLKTERLNKLIVSTMKQAINPVKPELNEMMDFKSFIKILPVSATNQFIAHCERQDLKPLKNSIIQGSDITILIGPEGDFSHEEILLAEKLGLLSVSLGKTRLRTETAGITACHTANLINE